MVTKGYEKQLHKQRFLNKGFFPFPLNGTENGTQDLVHAKQASTPPTVSHLPVLDSGFYVLSSEYLWLRSLACRVMAAELWVSFTNMRFSHPAPILSLPMLLVLTELLKILL